MVADVRPDPLLGTTGAVTSLITGCRELPATAVAWTGPGHGRQEMRTRGQESRMIPYAQFARHGDASQDLREAADRLVSDLTDLPPGSVLRCFFIVGAHHRPRRLVSIAGGRGGRTQDPGDPGSSPR